jgi:hypothetical protein
MNDFLSPTGPIFGPNFVVVTVDDAGLTYQLQIYPDASNESLREAGQPTHFYYQPSNVYLARKQDSPADYDFGMTVFKGLMTEESTIGITSDVTTNGSVETGGGFCAFATTFAVPDAVLLAAVAKLKAAEHPAPVPFLAHLFGWSAGAPEPKLGMMPVLENDVTIEVPRLVEASAGQKMPLYIDAQGAGKGSIEAKGRSAFLVTVNQLAAGAISGALENGQSPFTVHCNLKEQVYIHGCQVKVTVHARKCYDQFSAALSAGGFLGIGEASMQYAYSKMVTEGGVVTEMQMDSANLTPDLKDWVTKNVADMKTTVYNLLKSEIFDWQPREDAPATASRGLFSSIFGGLSVSLKASHQVHELDFSDTLKLDTTIAIDHTVSGTLSDLLPAVRADVGKYLSVIDIGEHFKKLQVAGTCAVDFAENVGGRDLADPVRSVQLEVSYPDYSDPVVDGKPNLSTLAEGFHYTVGHKDPTAANQLAIWTKDNPDDIVNIAFLRLEGDTPGWPADQVRLRKTVVFDGEDPRVDLADGSSTYVVETTGGTHAPTLTADEAGYVFVRMMLDRRIPAPNITVSMTCTIGTRTDTLTISADNQLDAIWEIFSDKYLAETSFTYALTVDVSGPGFTDDPVTWSSPAPVTVPLPSGRTKMLNPLKISLPPVPPEQRDTVNAYIAAFPVA